MILSLNLVYFLISCVLHFIGAAYFQWSGNKTSVPSKPSVLSHTGMSRSPQKIRYGGRARSARTYASWKGGEHQQSQAYAYRKHNTATLSHLQTAVVVRQVAITVQDDVDDLLADVVDVGALLVDAYELREEETLPERVLQNEVSNYESVGVRKLVFFKNSAAQMSVSCFVET